VVDARDELAGAVARVEGKVVEILVVGVDDDLADLVGLSVEEGQQLG
jgi:hypothetical protein